MRKAQTWRIKTTTSEKQGTTQKRQFQESAVHLYLKDKGHSLEDSSVHILTSEDWYCERKKEAIYAKLEWPSLKGGSLQHQL